MIRAAFVFLFRTPPAGLFLVALSLGLCATPAQALPAFAAQTGQPCQMCHVGGLGPQLTVFGRNFKARGYTLRATPYSIPLAAMVQSSFTSTAKSAPQAVAPNFADNNNFAVDQISLFLAGGFGPHFGAFIQATYDGVARAFHWDQLDGRATTVVNIKGTDVVLGTSVNNSPGVEDPWNTLPSWGFPYTLSELAPAPGTAPLLNGALAQTTLGVTGYAWINSSLWLEAGGFESPGASTLTRLGVDPTAPGDIQGVAPYVRAAYQTDVGGGALEIGVFGLQAAIHPGLDRTTGQTDHFTDLGVDGSYEIALSNKDVITLNARYLHEQQALDATCILDGASGAGCADNTLTDMRADVAYYWRNTIGGTIQVFDITGSANPIIYSANRIPRPDSSGVTFQLDATPFGGLPQPHRRVNVQVGVQYTAYTKFDGATTNFDGAGTKASDNNTLRVFTWFMF
jgi:hypothetical protein